MTAAATPIWSVEVADTDGLVRIELTPESNGHLGLTVTTGELGGRVTTTGVGLPREDVQHIRQVVTSWLIEQEEGSTS